MAKAAHCSITRRAVVAGSAAAVVAALPGGAAPASVPQAESPPDPIHAAIAAHERAYAAQRQAEPEDDETLWPLIEVERAAAEAFAATVPATLQGLAAALAYVRLLHARDDYPLLDDYHCYVLTASGDTALRRALAGP